MTEAEYLNPERFPVTTQKGLSLSQQQMIDAFNMDELEEKIQDGKSLSEVQTAAYLELQVKLNRPALQ